MFTNLNIKDWSVLEVKKVPEKSDTGLKPPFYIQTEGEFIKPNEIDNSYLLTKRRLDCYA